MNVQERIEALEVEFNERLKALKSEVQQEFPKVGDTYWSIDDKGSVDNNLYNDYYGDHHRQTIGNFFQTKDQAIFAVEKLMVEAELRNYSRPFKCGEINRYIFLDTNIGCLDVAGACYSQYQGTIYFETKDKAEDAIESVGEERIKKYIFGVEN